MVRFSSHLPPATPLATACASTSRSRRRLQAAGACALALVLAATASANGTRESKAAFFQDTDPAWSPQGGWIAFARYSSGEGSAICLIRPDGTHFRRVTPFGTSLSSPSWAPDGRRLAFSDARGHVFVLNLSTRRIRKVTSSWDATDLDWSPGGKRIAFEDHTNSADEARPQIVVIRPDGSDARVVANPGFGQYTDPTWSPDGKRLAFGAFEEDPQEATYLGVIDSFGGRVRVLLPKLLSYPDWSPDGTRVVASGIVVIDLRRKLETKLAAGYHPRWSPDGKRIVFAHDPDGDSREDPKLFVMNADGSAVRPLTG